MEDNNLFALTLQTVKSICYEENEKTLFMDCEAWRGTADLINKYFKKGNEIIVEGELYTNTYQTDAGENRHTTRLNVTQVHFTSGNAKSETTENKTNEEGNKEVNYGTTIEN